MIRYCHIFCEKLVFLIVTRQNVNLHASLFLYYSHSILFLLCGNFEDFSNLLTTNHICDIPFDNQKSFVYLLLIKRIKVNRSVYI